MLIHRDRKSIGSALAEGEEVETEERKSKSKPSNRFTMMLTSSQQHDELTQQVADNIDSLTERVSVSCKT